MKTNILLLLTSFLLAACSAAEGQRIAPDTNDGATRLASRPYGKAAIAHYNRAVEFHRSGFLNQAIKEYRAALETDPRLEPAWSNLGVLYTGQKVYGQAIEAFEKAIALNPERSVTLNGYASAVYATGRIDEAILRWHQTIEVDPTFDSAYYNLANALDRSGHHAEAQSVRESLNMKLQIREPYENNDV